MTSEYISPRLFNANLMLKGVIPANSTILSIIVEVFNTAAGTVTLQTEMVDSIYVKRILYLDDITAAGVYSGDSVKDYFVSRQNMNVKITGDLEIQIKILFWEAS